MSTLNHDQHKSKSPLQRIVIVGSSCAGKTTLGDRLSEKLDISSKDLDAFYWEKGWAPADPEIFKKRVHSFVSQDRWITTGNFSQVRDLIWERATHVIWIDLPLLKILARLFTRSIKRSFTKEELWNGNKETLWNSLIRPDSLLMWILKTHRRYRREYTRLMADSSYRRIEFLKFSSARQVDDFVKRRASPEAFSK